MDKTIEVNGIKMKIKEMKYIDSLGNPEASRKEWFKNLLKASIADPTPTDEFIDNLSFKDGNTIVKEINILNGLTQDFQTPSKQE